MVSSKHLLLALSQAAWAWDAPAHEGYELVWQENFAGEGGSMPNPDNWNIVTDINVNNELQKYTTSNRNLQISGGSTFQIVPWRDGTGWTSGRIESTYTFTPEPSRLTAAEGQIRFGSNDVGDKQGYWPAFWLLGDSISNGTEWPTCGEVDIFEAVNGELTGHGTLHCDACNEPVGVGSSVDIPDQGWHTWRVEWDRRADDWRAESLSWYRDGEKFHEVTGESLGDEGSWAAVAHSPMFFILNVAVGGNLVSPRASQRFRDAFSNSVF